MRCVHHGRACSEPPNVLTCPEGHRYMVRQLLGKGGFARVFRVAQLKRDAHQNPPSNNPALLNSDNSASARGEHGSLDILAKQRPLTAASCSHFALKVISKCRLGNSDAGRHALRNEISIHRELHHPSIVTLLSYWEDKYRIYLLLDCIDGPSLESLVRSRGRLQEPVAAWYASQMLEAISYLHANGIIHRDLKLANVLLSKDLRRVYICDFGLAAHADKLKNQNSPTVCGTANYVAPEVLTPTMINRLTKGFHSNKLSNTVGHSPKSDLWSLGVAIFSMLIGYGTFDGEDVPRTLRRIRAARFTFPIDIGLSANAKALIRTLLSEDHTRRPSADQALQYTFFTRTEQLPRARAGGLHGDNKNSSGVRSRISSPSKRRVHQGNVGDAKDDERSAGQSIRVSSDVSSGQSRRMSTPHPNHASQGRERRSSSRGEHSRSRYPHHNRINSVNHKPVMEGRSYRRASYVQFKGEEEVCFDTWQLKALTNRPEYPLRTAGLPLWQLECETIS